MLLAPSNGKAAGNSFQKEGDRATASLTISAAQGHVETLPVLLSLQLSSAGGPGLEVSALVVPGQGSSAPPHPASGLIQDAVSRAKYLSFLIFLRLSFCVSSSSF